MSETLDIHPASEAERLAAYRNVHDVWSGGLPMEQHLAKRLASPQHNRAEWFVGCVAGEVAASLACYPLAFHLHGETVPGIAIGSVHTLAAHRGRGYAPQLLAWVERAKAAAGVAISVLYSDVKPSYYARLGYQLCPAWCGFVEVDQHAASDQYDLGRHISISGAEALDELAVWYIRYHGQLPISIDRNDDYWRHLLDKRPADEFLRLEDADGRPAGYLRVGRQDDCLKLIDYGLASREPAAEERLYRALIEAARERSLAKAGGWLPDSPAARKYFTLQPRPDEITMLKRIDGRGKLSPEVIQSTSRFCEIDHV